MSGETHLCEVCRLLIEPIYVGLGAPVNYWQDLRGNHRSNSPSPHAHRPRGEKWA